MYVLTIELYFIPLSRLDESRIFFNLLEYFFSYLSRFLLFNSPRINVMSKNMVKIREDIAELLSGGFQCETELEVFFRTYLSNVDFQTK